MSVRLTLSGIVVLLVLAGCRQTEPDIHISVILDDYGDQLVVLCRSQDRYGYKDWVIGLDTAYVDSMGTFILTCAAREPDYYQVVGQNGYPLFRDVYLEPGDSIMVHVPARSDTTRVTYTGARAGAYAGYDRLDSLWRTEPIMSQGYYELAQLEIDSAWSVIARKSAMKNAVIDRHFWGLPDWAPLEQTFRDEIRFRTAHEHFDYLYYHNYYANDTFTYLVPEPHYYDFLDSIDLAYAPDHFSIDYMMFMSSFLRDRVFRDFQALSDSSIYADMLPLLI
ncbi:MAG: hypothetical protein R3330_10230, partial [Saprospiraceae bacterium]|nr:hypothetical protein [Saprospiraceae bacterium]